MSHPVDRLVFRLTIAVLACLASVGAGAAQAGVLEFDIGNANVYTLGDFSATGANVEGAIVAGGNLSYRNADLSHASHSDVAGEVCLTDTSVSPVSPVWFAETGERLKRVSLTLSSVASTGSLTRQYGGLYLTGTDSAVDVFDISSAQLADGGSVRLKGLHPGATVILNISGASVSATSLIGFADYNVVYNFYQARHVNVSSVALYGTVLAPLATVTGSSASIDGKVIAGAWDASVQVNARHYFVATDVVGFNPASSVPEPCGYAMLFAGLGLLILDAGRRKRVTRMVFDADAGLVQASTD